MTDAEYDTDRILEDLAAVIADRKEHLPEDSYTAELLRADSPDPALEKLGEETTELVLAIKNDDEDEIAHEAADIVYHLLVALAAADVSHEALLAELAARRE
jgi:phosphoribosyl-ATP pyrophosphohydrolase